MSTVVRSPLQTPSVQNSRFWVNKTAAGFDAALLVDLANDAYGGHPGQRGAVGRTQSGVFSLFLHPVTSARLVEVAVSASAFDTWDPHDSVTVTLKVTDGATTISSSNAAIPFGLKADIDFVPTSGGSRLNSTVRYVMHLDLVALDAAGLDRTIPWLFTFTVVTETTVYLEMLEMSEVSRFAVDDVDDPRIYQPRSPITETIKGVLTTLEEAFDFNRRTYHMMALAEGSPLTVTSTTYAAIPGTAQSETAGVPTPWVVPPRRIKGNPNLFLGCRYKTSGAGDGYVRLTTGTGAYELVLPGTSGSWGFATLQDGTLLDGATDTITWHSKVTSGSLSLASLWVCDAPQT